MILDDSYKKQQARYEFAAKYCLGSTLDYSFSSIMSYHGSKILLNNGAREIFTHDISNKNEELCRRTFDFDKKIIYSILEQNYSHKNNSVDCIIFSEIINEKDTSKNKLNSFNKILKQNGVLIISTLNKKNKSLIFDNNNNNNFSKDEFVDLLKTQFSEIELFSQKVISKKEIMHTRLEWVFKLKIKLRFFLSTFLLKFDKKSNFYNKYMKNKTQIQTEKLNTSEYSIIPYNEKHNPLFFVAVCHKTHNL